MVFFTGHIPDPAGHLKTTFDHYKRLLSAAALPLDASLERFSPVGPSGLPEHFDQNATGSCGGNATAGSIYTSFAAAGRPLPFIPSQAWNYGIARLIDAPFQPLTDIGSQPNQLVRGMAEFGIAPMQSLPDRFSDCDPITINDPPQLGDEEQAIKTLVVGVYGIFSFAQKRSDDAARAISSGLDLCVAINGGCSAFQGYSSGVLTGAALAGNLDHYVRLSAYRTVAGRRQFMVFNSWGQGWGESGNAWIDESALDTLGDLYVMTPNRG